MRNGILSVGGETARTLDGVVRAQIWTLEWQKILEDRGVGGEKKSGQTLDLEVTELSGSVELSL